MLGAIWHAAQGAEQQTALGFTTEVMFKPFTLHCERFVSLYLKNKVEKELVLKMYSGFVLIKYGKLTGMEITALERIYCLSSSSMRQHLSWLGGRRETKSL